MCALELSLATVSNLAQDLSGLTFAGEKENGKLTLHSKLNDQAPQGWKSGGPKDSTWKLGFQNRTAVALKAQWCWPCVQLSALIVVRVCVWRASMFLFVPKRWVD